MAVPAWTLHEPAGAPSCAGSANVAAMAEDLLTQARAGKLAPVYIVSSDQPVLVDRLLAAVRDGAVPPSARGFNYDVIEGKPSAQRILAYAQTLPMMATRRMIYVRDLGPLPADEAPALIAYFDDPCPSTVLFAYTSKLDKRLKLYAAANKKGFLHVLEAPRNPMAWIRTEAERAGVQLGAGAGERLADAVGNDLSRLSLVVEQLGLYAGQRAISVDDVDELVAETRERSVFELTDAIGAGDLGGALRAVDSLCDQRDSALGVIVMLARYVRQLGMVHQLRESGASRTEYPSALGVPPFVVDKLAAQARRYSAPALARTTSRLAAADRALKGDPSITGAVTAAQVKTLGRTLAERLVLERLVRELVTSAA